MKTSKGLILPALICSLISTTAAFSQKTTSEIVVKYNYDKGRAETEVKTKKVEQPIKNTNTTTPAATGTAKSAEATMNDVFRNSKELAR